MESQGRREVNSRKIGKERSWREKGAKWEIALEKFGCNKGPLGKQARIFEGHILRVQVLWRERGTPNQTGKNSGRGNDPIEKGNQRNRNPRKGSSIRRGPDEQLRF